MTGWLRRLDFERVGGTQPIKVDARVIASTNRNLEAAIREVRGSSWATGWRAPQPVHRGPRR